MLRRSFQGEDLRGYAQTLIAAAGQSDDPYLLLELSLCLLLCYQPESALAVLRQAIGQQQVYQLQRQAGAKGLRLLVIKTAGDLMANTPLECILEDQPVDADVVYVDAQHPLPRDLPEHDLVFVAIAEADPHLAILQRLQQDLTNWPRPVLNVPQAIPGLARPLASQALADIPGLRMPKVGRIGREALQAMADGQGPEAVSTEGLCPSFPWILRPQGTHAGQGLERIADTSALAVYLQRQPAHDFFLAPFVDYASADGLFRKYRIVMVDGRAWPCHMGVSEHWMVHYPYPEMIEHPQRRDEEARFFAGFDQDFGKRHGKALTAIYQRLGLDYVGFDCAETADGELLIFEVANALVIHAMDRRDLFPYKVPQMQQVFAHFAAMLQGRAGTVSS